jgi:exopolyphosphatase / guanosine-5'-triphosphate,3'-diphosphate pyrophosphatase
VKSPDPSRTDAAPVMAAVDLGSNSFHMVIARFVGHDLQVMDKLREPVRLAQGLGADRRLSDESRRRALDCLAMFGQRLRNLSGRHIRAVGTNTFRRAREADAFRAEAESALGAPIEILAGHEEARLIYLGVAQTSPGTSERRLVLDIGGGSTEMIIGEGLETRVAHSRQLGCVSFTNRHFPGGKITREAFRAAQTAAALELRPIRETLRQHGWSRCLGSSGTVNAIGRILSARGWGGPDIELVGLKRLRAELVERGTTAGLELESVRPDRWAVLPGGLAVLIACFKNLRIEAMRPAAGALREGVLYDLIGRLQHQDARERSIQGLVEQYHVDREQATRVEQTCHAFLAEVEEAWQLPASRSRRFLSWAASLHEIGLAVAYSDYHRHGAYLVANGELPGFSQDGQAILAAMIHNHRRRLSKELFEEMPEGWGLMGLRLSLLLRLAVLLHRSRQTEALPRLKLMAKGSSLNLSCPDGWLTNHPLSRADLRLEAQYLAPLGIDLNLEGCVPQ